MSPDHVMYHCSNCKQYARVIDARAQRVPDNIVSLCIVGMLIKKNMLKYCDCIYQNQPDWLKNVGGGIFSINKLNGIFKSSHLDWQIITLVTKLFTI